MKRLAKRLTAAVLLAAMCLTATVYSRTKPVELRLYGRQLLGRAERELLCRH